MLENVQQATIGPIIQATIGPGSVVYTDEYDTLPSCRRGATRIARSVMRPASSPATRMAMGSARSTSIPSRDSGRGCARGFGRIGGSHRRNCRCIWASSSSCRMSGSEARRCSSPWSSSWFGQLPGTPD